MLPLIIKKKADGRISKRWLLLVLGLAVLIIGFIISLAILAFEIKYRDEFFPGSKIGQLSLEGMTTI